MKTSRDGIFVAVIASCVLALTGPTFAQDYGGPRQFAGPVVADEFGNIYAYDWVWDGESWSLLDGDSGIRVMAAAKDGAGTLFGLEIILDSDGLIDRSRANVARWDGTRWNTIGTATGPFVEIRRMAVADNGQLIVGGYFERMDGLEVHNIAVWDSGWSSLGGGLAITDRFSAVLDIATDSDEILVAVGGKENFVSSYSNGAWTQLGGALGGAYSLALSSEQVLYVGSQSSVMRLEGSTWVTVGEGIGSGNTGRVNALAFDSEGQLFAGGGIGGCADKPGRAGQPVLGPQRRRGSRQ